MTGEMVCRVEVVCRVRGWKVRAEQGRHLFRDPYSSTFRFLLFLQVFPQNCPLWTEKKHRFLFATGFIKKYVFGFSSDTVTALFTVVNLIIDQRHSQLTSMLFMRSVVRIINI